MRPALALSLLCSIVPLSRAAVGVMPDYVYGVNLGNWILSEPWMSTGEWEQMGGESCGDCSACANTMGALTKKLGLQQANTVFKQHWDTWFTQKDVDSLSSMKLNSVRIPMSYSIVESLVERDSEFYPQGALGQLKRGLKMLNAAKPPISVLLDMHALPGVSSINSQFAGLCVYDPQFYQASNYDRALQWAAVMTALTHLDPDFINVYGLQAINEPVMDASKTPGLQGYYDNFARVVRAVELSLGVTDCPGVDSMASALGVSAGSSTGSGSGGGIAPAPQPTSPPTTTKHKKPKHTSHAERALGAIDVAGLDPRAITSFDIGGIGGFPVFANVKSTGKPKNSGKKPHHVASAIPSAAPVASPPLSTGPNLVTVLSEQSELSQAINATSLQYAMAMTLAQAGINFRQGPARNLFSSQALQSFANIPIASVSSGSSNHTAKASKEPKAALPKESGMKRHKKMLERRASANATIPSGTAAPQAKTASKQSNGLNPGQCIITNFHDSSWQGNAGANAKSSMIGPGNFDMHPYYSFGGVTNQDIGSYMQHACTSDLAAQANGPLLLDEWWVQTGFDASQDDMKRFGDAQKLMFRRAKGWHYWSFKITSGGMVPMDYTASVAAGLLTQDPSQLFDDNVCSQYGG